MGLLGPCAEGLVGAQVGLVRAIKANLCRQGPDRHWGSAPSRESQANVFDLTASGLHRKSERHFSASLKSLPILQYLYALSKQALF